MLPFHSQAEIIATIQQEDFQASRVAIMDNFKHSDFGGVNSVLTKNASSEALRQLRRQLAPNTIRRSSTGYQLLWLVQ